MAAAASLSHLPMGRQVPDTSFTCISSGRRTGKDKWLALEQGQPDSLPQDKIRRKEGRKDYHGYELEMVSDSGDDGTTHSSI